MTGNESGLASAHARHRRRLRICTSLQPAKALPLY
jgi:hypothetical protein